MHKSGMTILVMAVARNKQERSQVFFFFFLTIRMLLEHTISGIVIENNYFGFIYCLKVVSLSEFTTTISG